MTLTAEREPRKVYLERFIIMLALLAPSVFFQGARAAAVCVVSVVLCMAADLLCCKLRRIPYDYKDAAVPFWGLAAAMMMPSSISFLMVALSAALCICVGKHLFGGSDNIVFCPPAISAAFILICYPADMLYAPKYGDKIPLFGSSDAVLSRSAEYALKLGNTPSSGIMDTLMGHTAGTIGTIYILVIAVCGICMMIRRSSSLCAVLSCLAVCGLFAFFFPRAEVSGWKSVFYELSSGYLLFGTVFLAAEPYRCPEKLMGRVIYGGLLGYITMMFRIFGKTEGSFLFALLIVGALGSSFDQLVENLSYWRKTYLTSFEKNKTSVQKGGVKLSDTQEIVLPEKFRYETPPIDSAVKRHKKRSNSDNKDKEDGDEQHKT
ncbi:MAG: RnfABCDGE type electron transport complex subunit D [Oscillospiraceae bacterium]|nr:RnfABCDGE type electron transport complex subunit D [Oscillospiraceae bacterium]